MNSRRSTPEPVPGRRPLGGGRLRDTARGGGGGTSQSRTTDDPTTDVLRMDRRWMDDRDDVGATSYDGLELLKTDSD